MSISSGLKPLNAFGLRTRLNFSTVPESPRENLVPIWVLFFLVCGSTLTIWNTDPEGDRIYECSVLLLAGWMLLFRPSPTAWRFGIALCLLPLGGFLQLALGATVYRFATLQETLRLAGLSATAWVSYAALGSERIRLRLPGALAWFGFLVGIASVLAYYTSPGQILWLLDARYPDVWGPFLSRNNFAQFLEVTLPAALWLAFHRPDRLLYWGMSAAMLAAGLISASRAGAIVLCLEALAVFLWTRQRSRKVLLAYMLGVVSLASMGGAGVLLSRFASSPLAERDPIWRSTIAIVGERPWQGFGLGTFGSVYPEFALFDSGYSVDHAHNDWLEWTAEGGLGFVAVWWILFIPCMGKIRSHFWGLGLPAVLLHALVDFPMARTGIAAWVFFLLGAIERASSAQPYRRTT